MFNCYTHGWSSFDSMCPVCQDTTTCTWTYTPLPTGTECPDPTKPKPQLRVWKHKEKSVLYLADHCEEEFRDITADLAKALAPYLKELDDEQD